MAISQKRSKRKTTGGRYTGKGKKRQYELGSDPTLTRLDATKRVALRTMGGHSKQRQLAIDAVNIYDPKKKKHTTVKLKQVLENAANRNYIRRNILTKGAVIETDAGKARITSRPGQEGTLNAVLI